MDVGQAEGGAPRRRFRFLRGVLLEVRPLPMAAALLVVVLGWLWAGRPLLPPDGTLGWLLRATFFGLWTAHFMDSFVDVVVRGDRTPGDFPLLFRDSTGLLRPREYLVLIALTAFASALCVAPVALAAGVLPGVLMWGALGLAVAYAPVLDRTMAGVTFGYPAGATAVLLAAFLAAGGTPDLRFAWLAASLFTALVGIKVRADVVDAEGDAAIAKRSVAAVLGPGAAARVGYALAAGGLLAAAATPLLVAAPLAFALPPAGAAAAVLATSRMAPLKASLWMSHAMLAALAAEVAVLALA